MPIPQSDDVQDVVKSEVTTFPVTITPQIDTESVVGNKFAYLEFQNPQGATVIRLTLRMKVSQLHWDIDPDEVLAPSTSPDDLPPICEVSSRQTSWMTAHRFESVPAVTNPFADFSSLRELHEASPPRAWVEARGGSHGHMPAMRRVHRLRDNRATVAGRRAGRLRQGLTARRSGRCPGPAR